MGFMNSIKEALAGEPAKAAVDTLPRHVDRDAPRESLADGQQVTGGKHAARD